MAHSIGNQTSSTVGSYSDKDVALTKDWLTICGQSYSISDVKKVEVDDTNWQSFACLLCFLVGVYFYHHDPKMSIVILSRWHVETRFLVGIVFVGFGAWASAQPARMILHLNDRNVRVLERDRSDLKKLKGKIDEARKASAVTSKAAGSSSTMKAKIDDASKAAATSGIAADGRLGVYNSDKGIDAGRKALLTNVAVLLRSMPGSLLKAPETLLAIQAASALGVAAALLEFAYIIYLAFQPLDSDANAASAVLGLLIGLVLQLTMAWRFHRGKGLVIGSIFLGLTVLSMVIGLVHWERNGFNFLDVISGGISVIGYAFGIQAARANRKRTRSTVET